MLKHLFAVLVKVLNWSCTVQLILKTIDTYLLHRRLICTNRHEDDKQIFMFARICVMAVCK